LNHIEPVFIVPASQQALSPSQKSVENLVRCKHSQLMANPDLATHSLSSKAIIDLDLLTWLGARAGRKARGTRFLAQKQAQ
jgi:hypothetical protein